MEGLFALLWPITGPYLFPRGKFVFPLPNFPPSLHNLENTKENKTPGGPPKRKGTTTKLYVWFRPHWPPFLPLWGKPLCGGLPLRTYYLEIPAPHRPRGGGKSGGVAVGAL
eukprot:FR744419.1.p3 GENE.FR744419.1~~FR744419.1.p3  ORF type:complete len:111 (+),score=27.33 FR744419.1:929-1261(+)